MIRRVPLQRTAWVRKPRKGPYGGPIAPELGGTYAAFRKRVFDRDGNRCLLCGTTSNLTLAHLSKKVGMGGRRSSSVNRLENAVCLCLWCHGEQETSRVLTEALKRLLVRKYGEDHEPVDTTP